MDYDNENKTTALSILKGDEIFSSRILSRQTTVGSCSSRLYYRASEGVPFRWETQPGKPIEPPRADILPPLSPPPAVLSMGLPKPKCIDDDYEEPNKGTRRWSKEWLVKKIQKWKVLGGSRKICNAPSPGIGDFGSARFYVPSESSRFSSSSFASMATYSSANGSFKDKGVDGNENGRRDLVHGKPFTCNPSGFGSVLVYLAKR